MPLVSVIIPVYNRPRELPQALASLATQTMRPHEVIVVDDGSREPVPVTIGSAYPNLHVTVIRQENAGAPSARNRGFAASTGDFVLFWDADVVGDRAMIEKMHAALVAYPTAAFAYSHFYFGRKKMSAQAFSLDALRKQNYICTMSLIRRAAFPGFDESLKRFQDWDLWLTLAERGQSGILVPEYLFRIITHGGTMSSWLPRRAYTTPWRYLPGIRRRVEAYEASRAIIAAKHHL